MRTLKCLAVDDEPHALELLEAFVDRVPFLTMHQATTSPWEAIQHLENEPIDLLFLDIQMGELNGLQLLESTNVSCPVIITSAYSTYALDGYNYRVTDYLLKPYSFERFLKAVNAAKDASAPSTPENNEHSSEHLFVKGDAKNKFHQVNLNDILYIEGLKNYVQFFCSDQRIVTLQNIKALEETLPANRFIRTHRSYIVNIDKIDKIEGHMISIGQKSIPVSQSCREHFYSIIQQRGFGS